MAKWAWLALLLTLSLAFMLGCASPSKYVACCKRSGIYDLSSGVEALLPSPACDLSTGGRYSSDCDPESVGNGTIACQPDVAQCSKPLKECAATLGCTWDNSGSGSCRPLQCGDITDSASCSVAKCAWDSGNNECGPQAQAAYVPMSICVDAAPAQCINDRCSVMLCGYKDFVPAPPPSSNDWKADPQSAADAPAAVSDFDPVNLLGTTCTFRSMNQKTFNTVKNSRGALWANAFRFGVGDSFQDFEASRFFFPLSDRFCAGVVNPNAKDRFVNYVDAKDTWCAETSSYYTCTENSQNFTDAATCGDFCRNPANCQPATGAGHFECRESGFVYSNKTTCRQECSIVANPKACSLSNDDYPFLGEDSRYVMATDGSWSLDYEYYKNLLEDEYGDSGDRLFDYECETSADCMSGYCDYNFHLRGLCVNASDNDRRVDCGCYKEQVGGKTVLNCGNALDGYTVYRSVIKQNLNNGYPENGGRSQGGYELAGNAGGQDWLFNPWSSGQYETSTVFGIPTDNADAITKDNEIEPVQDGILFSIGSGGNLGNVGDFENQTYRFYVLDDGSGSPPPKLFANCGIERTGKEALYSAYHAGQDSPFWGTGLVPPEGEDGMGPASAKFCQYKFEFEQHPCTNGHQLLYMDGLLPTTDGTTCPAKLYPKDGGTDWPGTGETKSAGCINGDQYYYMGRLQSEANYWVYEISFDGNQESFGECKLESARSPPFIDARSIGWCEGCTFSTLASETLTDEDFGGEPLSYLTWEEYEDNNYQPWDVIWNLDADSRFWKLSERMPLYLQANIMPVLDVRQTEVADYYEEYAYCSYYDEWGGCSYDYGTYEWTNYNPLSVCNYNPGAAVYVLSDTSAGGIADHSAPSSSSNRGSANSNSDDALSSQPRLLEYLSQYGNAVESGNGHTVYLNGYAAAIWKSHLLKGGCQNAPLTAIFLNGYSNRSQTQDTSSLIGTEESPGTLWRFFYNQTMLGLYPSEAPLASRILKGEPDRFPGSIDLLAQEWYPTCDTPGTDAERIRAELDARLSFSRALLGNFSRPSMVTNFHFPAGSRCDSANFTEYIFRHKGELVDAGIIGVIYDNWDNAPTPGYLEDPSTGSKYNTPFCAIQNHSKQVLGITVNTYGQKVVAENTTCMCQPCDAQAMALGLCDKDMVGTAVANQSDVPYAWCNSGNLCTMPGGFTNYSSYFCAPLCASFEECTPCSAMGSTSVSCRIENLYGTYKTAKPYSELNDTYWNLLASLPAKDKCCIQKQVVNDFVRYTYAAKQGVTQRAELLQFPRRGEEGIDCGRTPDTSFLTYCGVDIPINQEETTCFRVN